MFTIEVKKKGKDEEFGFKDLEMFHQECYGGKIKQSQYREREEDWMLTCQRCGQWCVISGDLEDGVPRIVKTVMDGQERKIHTFTRGRWNVDFEVRVIQKKGN